MTDRINGKNDSRAANAERARLRHEQLFRTPSRMTPLDRDQHAQEIVIATTKLKEAVSGKPGPQVPLEFCPDMVATLIKYPELWDRLSMLSAQVQCVAAKLPVRARQLAIMRTMWLCGAPYQWGEHLTRTKQAGITDEELERIKEGSLAIGWNATDQAILAAVEEFRADTFVSDKTWEALAKQFDENQRFELLVLIGQFSTIAFVLNSLRIPLEHNNKGFLSI